MINHIVNASWPTVIKEIVRGDLEISEVLFAQWWYHLNLGYVHNTTVENIMEI